MEIRLVTYDRLGVERGPIVSPISITSVQNLDELPTLELTSAHQFPSELDGEPEVALQYCVNGKDWIEPRDARFRLQNEDFDHKDETFTRSYAFVGIGEALRGQTVFSAYGMTVNDEGKVQFKASSAGAVIKYIWDNCVFRGWTGYSYNFTGTHDSMGNPWGTTFTSSFDVETSLQSILEGFVAQGLVDYWWQGRTLNMVKMDAANAFTDHTLNNNSLVQFNSGTLDKTGQDSAPEKLEYQPYATHVIVIGEKNTRWTFATGIEIPEGRREIVLRYNGVDDEGSALILAAPHITRARNILKNTTRQFHISPGTEVLPLVSYKAGDWAYVYRNGALERMRIRSISLTRDEHGIQGYVELGDKVDEILEKLNKRIQGMNGGVGSVGAGSPPAPAKPRTPKAPSGLVINPSAYVNQGGGVQSSIAVSWAHDGKATDDKPISIKEYRLYYKRPTEAGWRRIAIVSDGTSTAFGPLETFSSPGVLATYEFAVSAVSDQNIESAKSPIVTKQMVGDLLPPETPTNLIATTFLKTVTVEWDGKGLSESGTVVSMAPDFRMIRVYESLASDMTGQVLVGELTARGVIARGSQPADVTRYYRAHAIDTSGNVSAYTPIVSATPQSVISNEEIAQMVDDFNQDISAAQSTADGKVTVSSAAPTNADLTGKPANALWTQLTGGKVVGTWVKMTAGATSWTPTPFDPVVIPQIQIGTGTVGELEGTRMKARSISVDKLLVTDQDSYVENGSFETGDFTGWVKTGNWVVSTTVPGDGTYRAQVQYNGGTHELTNNYPMFLKAGEQVRIKFKGYMDSITSGVQLGVGLRNANDTVDVAATMDVWTSAGWNDCQVIVTAQTEGVKRLYFYTTGVGTSPTGLARIDNVRMYKMNGGELLVDGVVTAAKINTQNLASDTGFIGHLETSFLVSDVFQGKSFTGGEFNQATFQTTSTAFRGVKMTPDGILAYDSVGNLKFSLSASSGRALITGRVTTGDPGAAGTTILPAEESSSGKVSGMFITRNGSVTGQTTAGAFVYDATTTSSENLMLRGANGGSVEIENGHFYVRGTVNSSVGARIGNFANWALGNSGNGDNYLPNLWISPPSGQTGYFRLSNAPTTSAGANALIAVTPEGVLYRSTSSIRYKADVQDWDADYRALQLRPRSWVDRKPMDSGDPFVRYYGYIAEEVEQTMPEFVTYNDFGEPESVTYDRMPSPATVAILKRIIERLDAAGI